MEKPKCKKCGYALKWTKAEDGEEFWGAAWMTERRADWENQPYGQSFGFCNVYQNLDHMPPTELERYVNEAV